MYDYFVYNDLDDSLQEMYDQEKLYSYHKYTEYDSGITFEVFNMWDTFRLPSLMLSYDCNQINYSITIIYNDVNYKYIKSIEIEVNRERFILLEDSKYTLNDFCILNSKNEILMGSEIKFIETMNKFLNLKCFI